MNQQQRQVAIQTSWMLAIFVLLIPCAHATSAIDHAHDLHRQNIYIETAGVFWLAAECLILVLMRAGKRHVSQAPTPNHFRFQKFDWTLATTLAIALCAIALYAPGRLLFAPSLPETLSELAQNTPLLDATVEAAYFQSTRTHHLIWIAFVIGWVILECAIVWYGIGVYRALRKLLHAPRP